MFVWILKKTAFDFDFFCAKLYSYILNHAHELYKEFARLKSKFLLSCQESWPGLGTDAGRAGKYMTENRHFKLVFLTVNVRYLLHFYSTTYQERDLSCPHWTFWWNLSWFTWSNKKLQSFPRFVHTNKDGDNLSRDHVIMMLVISNREQQQ